MKFHWGYKAALFYLSFVVFILFMVGKAMNQKFDLVTKDYYGKDLAYEDHIASARNSKALEDPLQINYVGDQQLIRFDFPSEFEAISGQIHFYKPDQASIDLKVPVAVDSDSRQQIDFSEQRNGLWRVKVEWQAEDQSFFDEKVFVKQ